MSKTIGRRVPYEPGTIVYHRLSREKGIVIRDDGNDNLRVNYGPKAQAADWNSACVTTKKVRRRVLPDNLIWCLVGLVFMASPLLLSASHSIDGPGYKIILIFGGVICLLGAPIIAVAMLDQ